MEYVVTRLDTNALSNYPIHKCVNELSIMWRAPRTTMVDPKVSPKDWHSTNQFLDMPRACPP